MNRMIYISVLALLLCGTAVFGQTGGGQAAGRKDAARYERVVKDNLWNMSRNISGMRQDSVSRSFAEVYGSYKSGDFRDTWQPVEGWSAGASTASIRHLERISFAGSFSFDQTEGYGMCGSMFIKPGIYPVDVLEFTPGRKTLQTYSFDGGFSYDAAPHWRIGAKMDFESANIAKRKDLRHTNKRLEMSVAPGFMYHDGDFAIGAGYIFEKNSETIEAEQVGTVESSYWAFLDKGMMYGVHSVWTGSGVHLKESGVNGFPVNDWSSGAAVQVQYKGLFAEAEYLNRRGRVGEKEHVWFRFPGHEAGAALGYGFDASRSRHTARMDLGWKRLEMSESILEKVTENGVNTVLNHGSNRILARETWSLSPEYEIVAPGFEFMAGAGFEWMNSLGSQMYPYVHEQALFTYSAGFGMLRRFGRLDFGGKVFFAGGKVQEKARSAAEDSGVQGGPFRLEDWYRRAMDYKTGQKTFVSVSMRYNFLNGMYIEGSADMLNKGLSLLSYHHRTEFRLAFGYDF